MGTAGSKAAAAKAATAPVPALPELVTAMQGESLAQDKAWRLRTYHQVLVGSDVVDWMMTQSWTTSRAQAVEVGQALIDGGFLHHVTHEHGFQDGHKFYRWRDVDAEKLNAAERSAREYDLIVIGAGSAGLTAASTAGKLGAKVLMVEKYRLGGDCTWSGCVPSKALLHAAKQVHTVRKAAAGSPLVAVQGSVAVDMAAVRQQVLDTVQTIYGEETPEEISKKGVDIVLGAAKFTGPNTISITPATGGVPRAVTGTSFVVATGAAPRTPAVPGLASVPYHTYETIFHNVRIPEHLIVLGGGPIGSELAQAYRFLGARVTIVSRTLLGKESSNAQTVMAKVFMDDGITHVPARPRSITCDHGKNWAPTGTEAAPGPAMWDADATTPADAFPFNHVTPTYTVEATNGTSVTGDMLLVATGRKAVLDSVDLPAAGVKVKRGRPDASGHAEAVGVEVSAALATNVGNIYVAGDALGGAQFTHLAGKQGYIAARNALFPGGISGFPTALPRVTFTTPEVASVGLTVEEAKESLGADAVHSVVRHNSHIDRSLCDQDLYGFVEMVAKKDGTILGATIVGARAGEEIGLVVSAMTHGQKAADMAGAVMPYPSHSVAVQQVASTVAAELFLSTSLGRVINGIYGTGPHPGAKPGDGRVQDGRFITPNSVPTESTLAATGSG